jgi:hypothetical protein
VCRCSSSGDFRQVDVHICIETKKKNVVERNERMSMILTRSQSNLEAVHFDLLGLTHADFFEELANIGTLIALQLNYLAVFLMINDRSITGKFLFQCAKEKFLIEFFANALDEPLIILLSMMNSTYLNRCKSLLSTTLLNTDMDQIRTSLIQTAGRRSIRIQMISSAYIGEWISRANLKNVFLVHTKVDLKRGRERERCKFGPV